VTPSPAPAPAATTSAPAPGTDEYAGVRKLLTSAHLDASALLAKAKETVARSEMDVRVAASDLNQARQHVEATAKGTVEAEKQIAKAEAAAAAIQKALDAVSPHTALADVQKTLTADLAKANQAVEGAKVKLADAKKAQQEAPSKVAQAEAQQVAKQKDLETARKRVPEYQAVVSVIQQTLDLIRQ
jgi:chromosome segregation ATPase